MMQKHKLEIILETNMDVEESCAMLTQLLKDTSIGRGCRKTETGFQRVPTYLARVGRSDDEFYQALSESNPPILTIKSAEVKPIIDLATGLPAKG